MEAYAASSSASMRESARALDSSSASAPTTYPRVKGVGLRVKGWGLGVEGS